MARPAYGRSPTTMRSGRFPNGAGGYGGTTADRWESPMTTLEKSGASSGDSPIGDDHRDGNMRRDIGVVGLLFAGVGSIIGSGWLFGALNASAIAGPAAIFSWAIGAVMILVIGLCFAELGTMFPLSGGVIRFPHL